MSRGCSGDEAKSYSTVEITMQMQKSLLYSVFFKSYGNATTTPEDPKHSLQLLCSAHGQQETASCQESSHTIVSSPIRPPSSRPSSRPSSGFPATVSEPARRHATSYRSDPALPSAMSPHIFCPRRPPEFRVNYRLPLNCSYY
jgi:hypothetical protein